MESSFDITKAINMLVADKVIPSSILPKRNKSLTSPEIIEMMKKGNPFIYDEDEQILYIVDKGEKKLCPDLNQGLSKASEWISDRLPEVFIDTEQNGNVRRSDEAESCYKLFCIAFVLNELRSDIISSLKEYDFDKMCFKEESNLLSFKNLLNEYLALSSETIKCIVSAAAYKLSNYKEKNELYFTGLLSQEEILELNALKRNIKGLITTFERDTNFKDKETGITTKLQRLQAIQKRDLEIELAVVDAKRISMIYRISKLTTEKLTASTKAKINKIASVCAEEYCSNLKLTGLEKEESYSAYKSYSVKNMYKLALRVVKEKELARYKLNPDKYKFKPKS